MLCIFQKEVTLGNAQRRVPSLVHFGTRLKFYCSRGIYDPSGELNNKQQTHTVDREFVRRRLHADFLPPVSSDGRAVADAICLLTAPVASMARR